MFAHCNHCHAVPCVLPSSSLTSLLSSAVGTYETDVTAHPLCLLEFPYPECCSCVIFIAGFGPPLLENESVVLNYSFKRHKRRKMSLSLSCLFIVSVYLFLFILCSREFVICSFKLRFTVLDRLLNTAVF